MLDAIVFAGDSFNNIEMFIIMQDQALAQSFSDNQKPTDTYIHTDHSDKQNDPIIRLDHALQRIFFALEKKKQILKRTELESQEFVANLDALICRVRNTLTQIDAKGEN